MKLRMYSVFDSKTATFGLPHYGQKDSAAIRLFADCVNDKQNPNNMWAKHSEDFTLYYIGEFDEDLGKMIPDIPQALVTGSALKNPIEQLELKLEDEKVPVN